ncbi:hypothetical protein CONLIGDRAFT_321273 [Coniochaeta ligniaria NRRL 30616]|uniref:Uncharacterized protein n=1 Tax=Coniochaeta ligniaria NRRL 30616 TaxID=1408157 RepID=A0A1J7INZ3_9PEZI|nr:hypothetical protein CONLIGDRAFT_321273 [Coniochaeta ligniaria NRRL 30616]
MLIGIPGAYAEVTHETAQLSKMATALADVTPTDNVIFPELLHQVTQAMLCSISAERLQPTRYAVVTGSLFSGHQQGPDEEFSVAETPLGNEVDSRFSCQSRASSSPCRAVLPQCFISDWNKDNHPLTTIERQRLYKAPVDGNIFTHGLCPSTSDIDACHLI